MLQSDSYTFLLYYNTAHKFMSLPVNISIDLLKIYVAIFLLVLSLKVAFPTDKSIITILPFIKYSYISFETSSVLLDE